MLDGKLHLLKRVLLVQSFHTLLWKLQLNLVSCFPKHSYRKLTHLLSLENISASFSNWLITRLAILSSLLSSKFTSYCGLESCSKYCTSENGREREILQTEHRLVISHQGSSHSTKAEVNRAGFAAGMPHLATSSLSNHCGPFHNFRFGHLHQPGISSCPGSRATQSCSESNMLDAPLLTFLMKPGGNALRFNKEFLLSEIHHCL